MEGHPSIYALGDSKSKGISKRIRSRLTKIWGMGLLGVATALAMQITAEFKSLMLHHVSEDQRG